MKHRCNGSRLRPYHCVMTETWLTLGERQTGRMGRTQVGRNCVPETMIMLPHQSRNNASVGLDPVGATTEKLQQHLPTSPSPHFARRRRASEMRGGEAIAFSCSRSFAFPPGRARRKTKLGETPGSRLKEARRLLFLRSLSQHAEVGFNTFAVFF